MGSLPFIYFLLFLIFWLTCRHCAIAVNIQSVVMIIIATESTVKTTLSADGGISTQIPKMLTPRRISTQAPIFIAGTLKDSIRSSISKSFTNHFILLSSSSFISKINNILSYKKEKCKSWLVNFLFQRILIMLLTEQRKDAIIKSTVEQPFNYQRKES